jgi:hypothetical protein
MDFQTNVSEQNIEYRNNLLKDIYTQNSKLQTLMNQTVDYQEDLYDDQLANLRNNLTREQRGRLFCGEKLEDILNLKPPNNSRYYNTSDEAAQHIPPDKRFEYQIGNHLLMYEINDLKLNQELKTIDIEVVVHDGKDWVEKNYTIIDQDLYEFVELQLTKNQTKSTSSESENTYFKYRSSDETIGNIQDAIYQKLCAVVQDNNAMEYLNILTNIQSIYTPDMECEIQKKLDQGYFPFQIINNTISDIFKLQ